MRLFMTRGDAPRFAMTVTRRQPDGTEIPIDLTDVNIGLVFTAKERLADGTEFFEVTRAGGGIVVTNALQGQFEVRVPASATAGIAAPRALYWDTQMTNGSEITTLDAGLLFIDPDVST